MASGQASRQSPFTHAGTITGSNETKTLQLDLDNEYIAIAYRRNVSGSATNGLYLIHTGNGATGNHSSILPIAESSYFTSVTVNDAGLLSATVSGTQGILRVLKLF